MSVKVRGRHLDITDCTGCVVKKLRHCLVYVSHSVLASVRGKVNSIQGTTPRGCNLNLILSSRDCIRIEWYYNKHVVNVSNQIQRLRRYSANDQNKQW